MTEYSIVFVNKSTQAGTACLYQGTEPLILQPDADQSELFTLAWFTKKTNPNTKVKFGWNYEFCFVWDDLIDAEPGRVVDAGETVKCDAFTDNNFIRIEKANGAYRFKGPGNLERMGLFVHSENTVPHKEAVAGIGMAGSGTFVRYMAPNMMYAFMLRSRPQYFIAFGDFETGQILDVEKLPCTQEVTFPPNVYSMLVTLHEDNTWTVVPNRMLSADEE